MFAGPGGEAERHPARPEFLFGGDEQGQRIGFHDDSLAERRCFREGRGGGEQPDRDIRHLPLQIAHGAVAVFGRDAEDGRDFPFRFAGEAQPRSYSVHFSTPKAAKGVIAAMRQAGAKP